MRDAGISENDLILGSLSYMSIFVLDEMAKGANSYFYKYFAFFPKDLKSYPGMMNYDDLEICRKSLFIEFLEQEMDDLKQDF